MAKFIPTITPDQTDEDYKKLLDKLGVTSSDFEEHFNSLFPLTPTCITRIVVSAGDVPLDNDPNEGLGDEGLNPNVPVAKFSKLLSS